jgi:hypothetical protein
MNIPGFNAESSLGPNLGIYRGEGGFDPPTQGAVSMQLDDPLYDRLKTVRLKNWDSIVKDPGPEFGTQTCDTGAADCAKRCINELNVAYGECRKIRDGNDRLACFEDALTRGSNCQTNCSTSFPPTPVCPPIGL